MKSLTDIYFNSMQTVTDKDQYVMPCLNPKNSNMGSLIGINLMIPHLSPNNRLLISFNEHAARVISAIGYY